MAAAQLELNLSHYGASRPSYRPADWNVIDVLLPAEDGAA